MVDMDGRVTRMASREPAAMRRMACADRHMACAALLSCAAALAACGGGGSSGTQTDSTGPVALPPATLEITLTVAEGAGADGGGSVSVVVGSGPTQTVSVGDAFPPIGFVSGAGVRLLAVPAGGYGFSGWTLTGGLSCVGDPEVETLTCVLDVSLAAAGASLSVGADFEAIATTLTVNVAGDGGSVAVEVTVDGGASEANVPDASQGLAFNVEATATLTAVPAVGYAFSGWTGACAGQEAACVLDDVVGDAEAEAAFVVLSTLTVTAGPNGSVAAEVGGAGAVTVGADSSQGFTVSVLSAATLTATAAGGYAFTGWTLSGPPGLACASGAARNPSCALAVDSLSADATATATFGLRPPAAWRGPGSVSASPDGPTHTADPYAPGAFEGWVGAPCNASENLACDVSSVMAGEGLPVAVFRPFVVGGIKSLAFGLGYHGDAPDHFMVSFQDAMGTGFTPLPGLQSLVPDSGPARLAVSVHRLPWGLGAYMTEACDASVNCGEANGGRQTLKQVDSVAATGYFKAPVAGNADGFGRALALSADGATLAVGARTEGSASTGTFVPGDDGYQDALDNDGTSFSGAVTVYRRSEDNDWEIEAFVKAPKAGGGDRFGSALALDSSGTTLAVGAPFEDSASTGTFTAPDGEGYQDALDSNDASDSGAVTVYRRSGPAWSVEAFVKAPVAGGDGFGDRFGSALALSADGATLAVGAPNEDSASTGTVAPGDEGYQAALDSDGAKSSGAVTVYRRSESAWSVEAFVKAPKAGSNDEFGRALALDSSGATLAVGAPFEDSASTGTFTAPDGEGYQDALDRGFANNSGAVTVYRRSGSAWSVEALVKAPNAGGRDQFGFALSLSGDGATLAVGAPFEDSASTGTFAPGDAGYQAALDSDGTAALGAVTVYRRSGSAWSVEAFLKAPKTGIGDDFGRSLALSEDSSTLAVGAPFEDSASAGVFSPSGEGHQAALDSDGASDSGAVTVYRRSGSAWRVETFVKAPVAGGRDDEFGTALALSRDGATLAVGARNEDGDALPQPVGGDSADTGNAVLDSGAAYLY